MYVIPPETRFETRQENLNDSIPNLTTEGRSPPPTRTRPKNEKDFFPAGYGGTKENLDRYQILSLIS
jgi:hypothetical protein